MIIIQHISYGGMFICLFLVSLVFFLGVISQNYLSCTSPFEFCLGKTNLKAYFEYWDHRVEGKKINIKIQCFKVPLDIEGLIWISLYGCTFQNYKFLAGSTCKIFFYLLEINSVSIHHRDPDRLHPRIPFQTTPPSLLLVTTNVGRIIPLAFPDRPFHSSQHWIHPNDQCQPSSFNQIFSIG